MNLDAENHYIATEEFSGVDLFMLPRQSSGSADSAAINSDMHGGLFSQKMRR